MVVVADPKQRVDLNIAQALLRDEPALLSSLDFGPFVRQGEGTGPTVLIGDQSEIALLASAHPSPLEHRMALLARSGDHMLLRRRDPAFEAYLDRYLGVKDLTCHEVVTPEHLPLTRQVWTSRSWVERLAAIAENHGGLTLKSYLTTGHTWRLAKSVGDRARQMVHVSGPSPRIARRSNDKLWFARLARRVIGENATPPTLAAYGPAATAGLVLRISRLADQVIIKVPDSAGSAGNIRLESAAIRSTPLCALQKLLLNRLHATGWRDGYPVLVGVWDHDVVCSPSVQMWLPLADLGAPRIEDIFEQRVRDAGATFVGAIRTTLPREIQDPLRKQAAKIACILQRLGYFGRCSFDAVICRTGTGEAVIHWIECNARWGGVSIPITAVSQIAPSMNPRAVSIVQEVLPIPGISTGVLLNKLKGILFCAHKVQPGVIVGAPPSHPHGALINITGVADTPVRADEVIDDAMRRIVGKQRL